MGMGNAHQIWEQEEQGFNPFPPGTAELRVGSGSPQPSLLFSPQLRVCQTITPGHPAGQDAENPASATRASPHPPRTWSLAQSRAAPPVPWSGGWKPTTRHGPLPQDGGSALGPTGAWSPSPPSRNTGYLSSHVPGSGTQAEQRGCPRPSGPQGCEGAGSRDGWRTGEGEPRLQALAVGRGFGAISPKSAPSVVVVEGGTWGETRDRAPSPTPKLRSSAAKCRADLAAAPAGWGALHLLLLQRLSPSLPGSGRGATRSPTPPRTSRSSAGPVLGAAAVPAQEGAGPSEPTWGPT